MAVPEFRSADGGEGWAEGEGREKERARDRWLVAEIEDDASNTSVVRHLPPASHKHPVTRSRPLYDPVTTSSYDSSSFFSFF